MKEHGDISWVVNTPRSPVPASLRLLALQLKPSLSGLRAPEPPFVFNRGDARDKGLLGRGVLTTPSVIGPFCTPEGA